MSGLELEKHRIAMIQHDGRHLDDIVAGDAGGRIGTACLGPQDQALVGDKRIQRRDRHRPTGVGTTRNLKLIAPKNVFSSYKEVGSRLNSHWLRRLLIQVLISL